MTATLKKYGLHFKKSIKQWDEAIPLGNGKLGCLIYGDGPLRFAIDRIDLWDNRQSPAASKKNFTYKKVIECAKGGEEGWREKKQFFDINYQTPYPSKLSAGSFELDFGEKSNEICSDLDIYTAKANVSYSSYQVETFVSAEKPFGILRVYGDYALRLHIPDYFSGDENGEWSAPSGLIDNDGTVEIIENGCLKYPRSKVITEADFVYYVQDTLTEYSFAVILLQRKCQGYTELYFTVATTDDAENFLEYGKEVLRQAASEGFEKLFAEHAKWWKQYWQKSFIAIPDKMLERTYYFSWYLFASTSRKGGYPMPLQGVWTADSNALPPWNGDYHHDTNTQLSYWGYAKANRLDEGRVFADYLWNLRDTFKKFAKKVYGVDGYLLPGCSTLDGKFMGGCVQYSLSPTMTVWAAKAFDDYYTYSGDRNFLKSRAFPFFEEVAKAVCGLFEERNGRLYLPISTSPEIFEGRADNFTIGNTNFDQSLILYLYQTLVRFCDILGKDKSAYEAVLSRLDGLYVSQDNVLMLSERIRLPFSHRHFSHLMCVYPLRLVKYDTEANKKLIDNSMLELEQLGSGWWVGFSFPWCATLYAIQGNGNAAYEKLRMFNRGFLSPNGFHLNGDYQKRGFSQWHYRPFTLEALFAYCDSVQEMLLQECNGYLELFPAIPLEWNENATFKKLRTYGGVLISAKIRNGVIKDICAIAKKETVIRIKNNFSKTGKFTVVNQGAKTSYSCAFGAVCQITLGVGKNTFAY